MRNRKKNKNILDTPLPSSQTQLHSPLLPLLSPSRENMGKSEEFLRGTGNGCYSLFLTHCFCCFFPFTLFPCSIMVCFPYNIPLQTSPVQVLKKTCSIVVPIHEVHSLRNCSISDGIAPSLLPCRTTFPFRKQVSVWDLLHGVLQKLPTVQVLHRPQFIQGFI